MKPIKIFHTADIHCSRDTQDKAFLSLDCLIDKAEKEKPDLLAIAGDLYERPMNNTTSSGLPGLVDRIEKLLNICPVVAVKGTPSHDLPGSYKVFKKIKAKHNFTLLEPSIPYLLNGEVWIAEQLLTERKPKLLILGLPEPQKTWLLKDKQLGKAEADEAINQGMRELLLGLHAIRRQYPDIPCLFVGHIEIANTPTCTGHIIQGGIKIGKDDLRLIGADYYALGHIHLAQQIGDIPAYYPGSVFPVDWGETDQKGFLTATIEKIDGNFIHAVDRVHYPHPPRKKVTVFVGEEQDVNFHGFQVRVVCKGPKEALRSIDSEERLKEILECGAAPGSQFIKEIIPTETVRCEGITEATHLRDKVKIYADLSGDSISDSILQKADGLEAVEPAFYSLV